MREWGKNEKEWRATKRTGKEGGMVIGESGLDYLFLSILPCWGNFHLDFHRFPIMSAF